MTLDRLRKQNSSWMIRSVLCFFTLAFYVGALCAPDLNEIFSGFVRIVTNPAQLTKDYFRPEIGSISGAFFNTALVGTVCCALLFLPGAVTSGLTVTGYMLTVGFSFWGMNLVNILPFMFGTFVYSLIKREPFAKFVNFAMFSTALGPLASEMLYRYPGTEIRGVTLAGIGLALLIGVATGVAMPALCAHAKNFHKGYSLYNAGAAAGFWCFFLYATLYRTLGVEAPAIEAITSDGLSKTFVDVYCIVVFVLCIIAGFILSGNSFKGYWSLLKDTGYQVDFGTKYGNGPTVMNFGIYGLFIVLYYNLIGAKFTGATFGAIFCMLACCCTGATPRTVFPIMIGYFLASRFGQDALNAQAIVVGLYFASGLAPVSGNYGIIAGIVAGMIHYCIVTSAPAIHGGFNLYNGGFTACLTCFVLVPILEHFFKTKEERKLARAGKNG